MTITRAERGDLPEILELQRLAYQSQAELLGHSDIPALKQTLEEMEAEFEAGIFLKAVDEAGALIGSVRGRAEGDTLLVGKLMAHPGHRGRGIGTALLRAIERAAPHPRYELFTSTQSLRNIELYRRMGYRAFKNEVVSHRLEFVYMEKLAAENPPPKGCENP